MKNISFYMLALALSVTVVACGNQKEEVKTDVSGDVVLEKIGSAGSLLDKAKELTEDAVDATKDAANDVADGAKDAANAVADTTKDAANNVVETTKDAANNVADGVKDVANDAADAVEGAVDATADATKNAVEKTAEAVTERAEQAVDAVEDVVEDAIEEATKEEAKTGATYVAYSPENAAVNKGSAHILYFAADWCPSCVALDKEIVAQMAEMPNVSILKANYDTETELKKQYNVSSQHTGVFINADGSSVTKPGITLADIKAFGESL